jgi:hypothetical protein
MPIQNGLIFSCVTNAGAKLKEVNKEPLTNSSQQEHAMPSRNHPVRWIAAAAMMIGLTACAAAGGPGTTSGGATGGDSPTLTSEPFSGGAAGTPTEGMTGTTIEASSGALASLVINNYGYLDICAVHTSLPDSTAWGENVLGDDVIPVNGRYTLNDLPARTTDFRVSDCNGDEIETWLGYPVKNGEIITWNVVVPMPEPTCGGGGDMPTSYDRCQYTSVGRDRSAICAIFPSNTDLCHIWVSTDTMSPVDRLQDESLYWGVFAITDLLPGQYHVSAEDCGGSEIDAADIFVKEDTIHLWMVGE